MSGTSRSQVTITLGRSGQVVKRPGLVFDSGDSDRPHVGSKRSVRDRLGSSPDAIQLDSKRHRGDVSRLSSTAANGVDDIHLNKDDLRYKIMKKTQNVGRQNGVDLRKMLSRSASSVTSAHAQQRVSEVRNGRQEMLEKKDARHEIPEPRDARQRIPEPRDIRQRIPEPRDIRQHMPEPRNVREHMPEARDVRQRMPEPRDVREYMPEPRDVRHHMPEPRDVRHHMPDPVDVLRRMPELNGRQRMPEPTNGNTTSRVNSTRSSEPMSQMGLMRSSYSPWTLDHIRRRSPDRVLETPRGLSPPRSAAESQRRPVIRTYDDLRSSAYVSRDIRELPRPMASNSFMEKSSLPAGPMKPAPSLVAPPPSAATVAQRSAYPVEEPTLERFLHHLGLDKYTISFKVEEVDMATLSQMGDHDLKELGIPMGPRKKILLALLARSRRQAR